MLQKELYVTSTKPAPSVTLEMMMEVVPPHLEFQVGLEQRGIMFAAGPLFPSGSELWQGEGLIIVRASACLVPQLGDSKMSASCGPPTGSS